MTTFRKPSIPSIPFPENNQKSMLATIVALKGAVEMLLGTRGTQHSAAHVFLQDDQPTGIAKGDFWLKSYPTATLSYWTGQEWQVFAITHADGSLHSS